MLAHFATRPLLAALGAAVLALGCGGMTRAGVITSLDSQHSAPCGSTQGPGLFTATVAGPGSLAAALRLSARPVGSDSLLVWDGGAITFQVQASDLPMTDATQRGAGMPAVVWAYPSGSAGARQGPGHIDAWANYLKRFSPYGDPVPVAPADRSPSGAAATEVWTLGATGPGSVPASQAQADRYALASGSVSNRGANGPPPPASPARPVAVLLGACVVVLGLVGWSRRRARSRPHQEPSPDAEPMEASIDRPAGQPSAGADRSACPRAMR
jgi:hypothetical protein